MTDTKTIWESALVEIEVGVSKANFNTWFKNTFVSKHEDGTVYLSVPNAFVKDWLATKYHKSILRAVRNNLPSVRSVEYVISKNHLENGSDTTVIEKRTFNEQLKLQELEVNRDDGINPRYTFENFIVGSFNETVHAASQAVVKNPGMAYNPLFIYGGTGLGKTHLIQAIGNQIKKLNPNKKIFYLTSEKFTIDYVYAIQNNKIQIFKKK